MANTQETPDQSQKAEPLPETREHLKAYQRLSDKIQEAIEKGGLKVGDKLKRSAFRGTASGKPSARFRNKAS